MYCHLMKREQSLRAVRHLNHFWRTAVTFVLLVGISVFASDAVMDWARMPLELAALRPVVPLASAVGLVLGLLGMFLQVRFFAPDIGAVSCRDEIEADKFHRALTHFVRVRAASFAVISSIAAVGIAVAVTTDDTWIVLPFCGIPLTLLAASYPRVAVFEDSIERVIRRRIRQIS
jgi:hypothetical protein